MTHSAILNANDDLSNDRHESQTEDLEASQGQPELDENTPLLKDVPAETRQQDNDGSESLEDPEHSEDSEETEIVISSVDELNTTTSSSSAILPPWAIRVIGTPSALLSYPAHLILFVLSPLVMMQALKAIAKQTFGIESDLAVKILTFYFTETAAEVEFSRFYQALRTEVMLKMEREEYGDRGSLAYQAAYAFVHANALPHALVKSLLGLIVGTKDELSNEVQAVVPATLLEKLATGVGVARSYGLQAFFVLPAAYALLDGLAGYFYGHTTPTIQTTGLQILLATCVLVIGSFGEYGRIATAMPRSAPKGIFNAYTSGLNDAHGHLHTFLAPFLPIPNENRASGRLNPRAVIASIATSVPGEFWQLLAANLPMLILPEGLYERWVPEPTQFALLVISLGSLALLFLRLFSTICQHIVAPSRRGLLSEENGTARQGFWLGIGFPSQVLNSFFSRKLSERAPSQIAYQPINGDEAHDVSQTAYQPINGGVSRDLLSTDPLSFASTQSSSFLSTSPVPVPDAQRSSPLDETSASHSPSTGSYSSS